VAQLFSLGCKTHGNQHKTMNNNTRPLTYISLGLLLAAALVPFIFVALGRDDLAVGFSIVAGLLALCLWAFSQPERAGMILSALSPSKRTGKFVIVGLWLLVVVVAIAFYLAHASTTAPLSMRL
jgi:predicted membrane channel-forming protein YqfA (hemolysin III family)